jgi:hypothetical protein
MNLGVSCYYINECLNKDDIIKTKPPIVAVMGVAIAATVAILVIVIEELKCRSWLKRCLFSFYIFQVDSGGMFGFSKH